MAGTFSKIRVLFVDDNMHMRTLMRSLLNALGVTQLADASDGGHAFAVMNEFKPDIVITDLTMEPVDGIEFTRMVRSRKDSTNPFVPIIMVTGHTERSRVEAARDAGVTEFIAKPITVQNLTGRLNQIIERPRPFIRSDTYIGPDRRRRNRADEHDGPWRRHDDRETVSEK
ncbi:MAG: response regulator [Rhizomicrobium sp.]|jgi:CheY-like chemotaxis protein